MNAPPLARGLAGDDAAPRPATILLLDDDPDVGLAAQLLLQRRVAPVTCLRRPAELIAAIDRLRPDLLLLDMNFGPGRTDGAQGLGLLAEVQARPEPPVVVVMTAYADIDLAVQALRRGAFDFITKPWDNVRLVAACHEALAHRAEGRRAAPAGTGTGADASRPAATGATASVSGALPSVAAPPGASPRSLAALERAAVLSAMAQAEGNLSAAARLLGLSRAALYRRLDKHGL